MLRKILTWASVACLAFYLISDPSSAGHAVHAISAALAHAGSSLGSFVGSL